jgi:hypothetical protein
MDLPAFVPTPEEGLEQLSPVTPHLQPALDNALFKSTTYVEAEELNCDASTFLTLVRAHAKSYLVKRKLDGIRFKDWSLSGIEFEVNGAFFRCWKGAEKELPPPGESKGRRKFLNQQYPLPFDYGGTAKIRNFVVLYTVEAFNKLTLWLVCPKKYDDEERIAEAWWWIQIPDPASTMSGKTSIGGPPSDDLPLAASKVPKAESQSK